MTDPRQALTWAMQQGPLSREDVEWLLSRLERTRAPWVFYELFRHGLLTDDAVTLASVVWSMDEYTHETVDEAQWKELFEAAGYTEDGHPAPRPREPIRLYRGSTLEHRRGGSWTTSYAIAQWYATSGTGGRPQGAVWTVVAPPERLLCHNTGREEDEYVLDTTGLTIEEAPSTPG
jgi:hypothetical protein